MKVSSFEDLKPEDKFYFRGIADIVDSLDRYYNNKIPNGDFMTAVLANDFQQAVFRADFYNSTQLKLIATYVSSFLPGDCYGSYDVVKSWLGGK